MKISFVKMHGLGNDFLLADNRDGALCGREAALAAALCNRRTGAGADGLLLMERPADAKRADIRMRVFNSDGSEAAMCGNGIRCFARCAYEGGMAGRDGLVRVQTGDGVKEARVLAGGEVRIGMGAPRFLSEGPCALTLGEERVEYWPLVMGVEHAVVFVEDPCAPRWMELGAKMEWAAPFPAGTNVDFIRVEDAGNIVMRVFERGCGPTLCCGTGATAAALCAMRMGLCSGSVRVRLELGALQIDKEGEAAFMQGPAAYVYRGEAEL